MILIKFLGLIISANIIWGSSIDSVFQQKCGNCHGYEGDKAAMGKSKAIKGMPVIEIEKALNDYATGEKKAFPVVKIMKKNFLDSHTKEETRALAEYINTL